MRKRRDTHEAEAFHLSVKLFDLDSHAAHLHICSRFDLCYTVAPPQDT